MARKSRKAEKLKQEIISSVPVEQRKLITQPITFTYLNGEMTMAQTRIQTVIMEKLQDKIRAALERKAKTGLVGDLFDSEDYKPIDKDDRTNYLTFTVSYSELGVDPQHYNDVDVAARAMMSIVYEKEVDGKLRYTVAFPVVEIDKDIPGKRRQNISLHMTASTAKDLFRITPYHRYLKDAIFLFSSGYTGRIYLLINANKQLGTWVIEYEKLRKILLTVYDKETKTATVDKYRDINDFKKRVLEPARREIAEAADRVDCTFDYEFRYPAGKKRGTPESIVFHIHLTDLGRNIKQAQLESQESVELRNLLCSLNLSVVDANRLMKQCPAAYLPHLATKARSLKKYMTEIKAGKHPDKTIENPRTYTLTTLRNFILEHTSVVTDETSPESVQSVEMPSQQESEQQPDISHLDRDFFQATAAQFRQSARFPDLYDELSLHAVEPGRATVAFQSESRYEVFIRHDNGNDFLTTLAEHFGSVTAYSTSMRAYFPITL